MTPLAMSNRPDLFQVMEKRCNGCLFTKDRIVCGDRAAEIIQECRASGRHFVCHKASLDGGKNVCCREFFDRCQEVPVVRLAVALGKVVFVRVETEMTPTESQAWRRAAYLHLRRRYAFRASDAWAVVLSFDPIAYEEDPETVVEEDGRGDFLLDGRRRVVATR